MGRCILVLVGLGLGLSLYAGLPEGYDTLIVDRGASLEVFEAAEDLATLLKRTYGVHPKVRRQSTMFKQKGLHIGPDPDGWADDGGDPTDRIRIERTESGLEIRGMDDQATCFAVYRFIEKYLGWRYYQPGELGYERMDKPPVLPNLNGQPDILLEESAAYFSRNLHGLGNDVPTEKWRRWHGLRERFSFNHSLHQVITPDLFEKHPDWFARNASGNPKRPPYSVPHGHNDHPDLSNPELRAFVAQKYVAALSRAGEGGPIPVIRSPGTASISLSLADSYVFGSFDDAYKWLPSGYFRRWPDWSNHVFDFTNAVAGMIEDQLPGQDEKPYFGALAYLTWEKQPDFPVHPSVVPYLTNDRSQWYNLQTKLEDLANVSRWANTGAPFTGTWDYLFSDGFLIPRSLNRIVSDSIPELYERGVRAYFSQVGAIWPYDGHTNWLASRLMWNPQSSPEALLDEYFREFYGPAANHMREFFEQAEALWMDQSDEGWWLRFWRDPWQASLWSNQDIRKLDDLLEAALTISRKVKVTTTSGLSPARFYSRIRQTADLFDLTKRFVRYQQTCWRLQSVRLEDASTEALEAARMKVHQLEESRRILKVLLAERLPGHDSSWVWQYDFLDATAAAISLRERTRSPSSRQVLHDCNLAKINDPRIWHQSFLDSQWLRKGTLPEGKGFYVENARRGHIHQLFNAESAKAYLASVDVFSKQSPSGEIYVRMDFFDDNRNLLGSSPRGRMSPLGDFISAQRLRSYGVAPEGTVQGRLLIRFYEMDTYSRAEIYAAQVMNIDREEPR